MDTLIMDHVEGHGDLDGTGHLEQLYDEEKNCLNSD